MWIGRRGCVASRTFGPAAAAGMGLRAGRRCMIPVLVTLVVLLAGCGAGQLKEFSYTLPGGSDARVGDISVNDVSFPYQGPVGGDAVYRPGDTVDVQATIVNDGAAPDRLLRVSSPIAGGGVILGGAAIPGHHALAAGYTGPVSSIALPDTTPIVLELTDLNTAIRAGLSYPVVFTFARGGEVRLDVRVKNPDVPRTDCPLPPDGKVPSTFTAPTDAPPPPTSTPPDCSTLR